MTRIVIVVSSIVAALGILGVLLWPHLGRGYAMAVTDETLGSIRCVTQHATTCQVSITNDLASHHAMRWTLENPAQALVSGSPQSGTLRPGETAHVQVAYPAAHACPEVVTVLLYPQPSGAPGSLTLTWRCP